MLYAPYYRLVVQWVAAFTKHRAPLLEIPAEELVADAFTSFWRAFTGEKLQQASGLVDNAGNVATAHNKLHEKIL